GPAFAERKPTNRDTTRLLRKVRLESLTYHAEDCPPMRLKFPGPATVPPQEGQAPHRCAYLVQPGEIDVREVPMPRPGPGQVLVRIERALAGGTDRKAFERGHPQIPMPGPFGHRYAGTVAALGPGAPPLEPGQPVMGVHSAPCLACGVCRGGRWHL